MSVLDKNTLKEYIKEKKVGFVPDLSPAQFQPNSVDLRLGYEFYIPKTWKVSEKGREIVIVDIDKINDNFEKIELKEGQYFEIGPGEFIIGTTYEKLEFNSYDYMGVLYPRSSINRRGLSVDLTGIIDTAYHGKLFIPVKNTTLSQIIRVHPEERFVQLVLYDLHAPLTFEESMKHGISAPKYHDHEEICYIPDKKKNK